MLPVELSSFVFFSGYVYDVYRLFLAVIFRTTSDVYR